MKFYEFKNWILKKINVTLRLQAVFLFYIISLMVETRKHSITFASELSGVSMSSFSKFLLNNDDIAIYTLSDLSKTQAKQFSKIIEKIKSLPWKICIIIDDVVQGRSSTKSDNVQKFNHGNGYVIGHQWTNIILFFNDIIIPLPPIPFYTKKYCRENKIEYKSRNDKLVDYLNNLNLDEYIYCHEDGDVIVLTDSGFDDKKIQNTILGKGWHFISALKSSRGINLTMSY